MDPKTEQLLNESLILARENNKMLQKLMTAQKWAMITRAFYWGLIVLSLFGSYFFLQPYLTSLLNLYSGGASGGSSVQDLLKGLNSSDFQKQVKELNQ
jgi:hypothetical protein